MTSSELRKLFLRFFNKKGHKIIPSASLIPENDPTVLFTTAGMHPLVPFLLGEKHPSGKRLTSAQKCIRTVDIDEVGDDTHNTFFEMLGNWSLGDYFKKESLSWSYEFLTKVLKIPVDKINVTVFAGNDNVPRDTEAANIWISLGIAKERVFFMPEEDNFWWAGPTGPCGPDSEIFIDTGKKACSKDCKPGCKCAKFVEVWNNVFMTYTRDKSGVYSELKQKNIDTGMGVERTIAMLSGKKSIWETGIFTPLLQVVKANAKVYVEKSARIIVDHVRAAVFILGDERGVVPDNTDQGYILRRLIRRAIIHGKKLGIDSCVCQLIAKEVIKAFSPDYPILGSKRDFILGKLAKEEERFLNTLEKGLNKFNQLSGKNISGEDAFFLFQSYGFPLEMTVELADENGVKVDTHCFYAELEKHQELSRKGAEHKFKGGLADSSVEATRLHTATHLLAESLRKILSGDIKQKGSNITPERLRFDFNFARKVTPEELKKVEDLVNEMIKSELVIDKKLMSFNDAKALGCECEFEHKYDDNVFVYRIGDFSKEVCGGPHVSNTSELGHFKIIKEEAVASGVRRIKAVLEV